MITHQQQPDAITCTSACLAMLTNIPVGTVVSEFHDAYFKHETEVSSYLESKGLKVERLFTHSVPIPGDLYLITVPSLNKDAALHNIILDLRDEYKLYDPNEGVDGKRYYIIWDEEIRSELEVVLSHYVVDLIVKENTGSITDG
ncbi:MAG: hypothetical protein COA63_010900 [Methylophaga sp.]|nr:hypothetical protein [Methylophaga sp.]